MIAVGVANYNFPELQEIATDPETHVFRAKDFDELLNLVASLRKKTCTGEFITEFKAVRATGSLVHFFDTVWQNEDVVIFRFAVLMTTRSCSSKSFMKTRQWCQSSERRLRRFFTT